MAGNGGRVAGIVSIVLSILAAVVAILFYTSSHPKRGLALLVVCGVLLILGIVLVVMTGRKSPQVSGQ
jgi:membrane protease YdiL (CAAX protease family)